jgi:hypothetical protein
LLDLHDDTLTLGTIVSFSSQLLIIRTSNRIEATS